MTLRYFWRRRRRAVIQRVRVLKYWSLCMPERTRGELWRRSVSRRPHHSFLPTRARLYPWLRGGCRSWLLGGDFSVLWSPSLTADAISLLGIFPRDPEAQPEQTYQTAEESDARRAHYHRPPARALEYRYCDGLALERYRWAGLWWTGRYDWQRWWADGRRIRWRWRSRRI